MDKAAATSVVERSASTRASWAIAISGIVALAAALLVPYYPISWAILATVICALPLLLPFSFTAGLLAIVALCAVGLALRWGFWLESLALLPLLLLSVALARTRSQRKAAYHRAEAQAAALSAQDERLRLITEATRHAIYDWDLKERQIWRRISSAAVFDSDNAATNDMVWWVEQIHPEDQVWIWEDVQNAIQSGASHWTGVYRRKQKDGGSAYVEDHALIVRNDRGHAVRVVGAIADITERIQAEKGWRESDERLRLIFERTADIITVVSPEGFIKFASPALKSLTGFAPEEVVGKRAQDFAHPDDVESLSEALALVTEEGEANGHVQYRTRHKSGHYLDVEAAGVNMLDNPVVGGLLVSTRDISQRKSAEMALRESEARFAEFMSHLPGLVYIRDESGRFTYVNDAFGAMFSTIGQQCIGKSFAEVCSREFAEAARQSDLEVLRDKSPVRFTESFDFPAGRYWFLTYKFPISRVDGSVHIGAVSIDITDRVRAEQAVQESEERYRSLFENANDIVYTHDLSGRFLTLNRVGEQLTGYTREEASRMHISDVVAPEYLSRALEMIAEKISGSDPTVYELEIVAKDGRRIPVEVSTRLILQGDEPVAVQGIARDITERKAAEATRKALESQVQHAQKLESLGVLAGGIAHDFNNLLTGVLGNASLALMDLPADSPMRTTIEHIESAAHRAAELCRQLLAYSGKGKYVVSRVDLNELIAGMSELLRATVGASVDIEIAFADAVPPIEGDASQIRQIILNLVMNSSDALEGQTGRVTVRTGVRTCSRDDLSRFVLDDELPEGEYAFIQVEDDGCGMDPETRARIFEPFFTTKFTGRGLGMPAVLGIVRAHHGGIQLTSEVGKGSTFTVFLPTAALPASGPPAPDRDIVEAPVEGRDTVLVADDERMVRELACTLLKRVGYRVFSAADGQAAVDLYRNHAHEIDVVLLDMTMPRLTGEEAFEALKEIRSDVRVILSSGYDEAEAVERFANKGLAGFIQKPYRPNDLFQKIGDALSAKT